MKPYRSTVYRAYIRSFPCLVCGTRFGVECCHVGPHGLGQKSSDKYSVPLCRRHHRTGNDALDKIGRRRFEQLHNLDLNAIIAKLSAKPRLKLESGKFVAYLNGETFVLRSVEEGIKMAVRQAVSICRETRIAS
jgi:hypothetical protein